VTSSIVTLLARAKGREITFSPRMILSGVLILGALLRFGFLGQYSLWFDEAFVAHIASRVPWDRIPTILREIDAHPPLYYLFMKGWVAILGTSEVSLRIPSAVFSTLSILVAYFLARRITSPQVALLTSLLIAVSPLEIIAGQEARMYPLLQLLTLASTLLLLASLEQESAMSWLCYGLVSAAMIYTHYLGVLVLAAHGLWVTWSSRRHLLPWVLTAAGVLTMYLPWLPSLWYQTVHGHGWAWYRPHLSWQALGDLGGLYAFGGSLFGMGDYFAETSLAPMDQLLLLAPFLVVFSLGLLALRRSGTRHITLVGCLLGVPIGAPLLVSLWRPMFYPRWFSFLFPVYAIVMAAGISSVADAWNGRKDRIVAFVTAGLLLYSIPVLGRYYLDPTSRPYNWRGAAAVIANNSQPGDFLLYTNEAAEIAFTYYYHQAQAHPSLTLTPIEALPEPRRRPTFDQVQAQRLAAQYQRLWVIATPPFTPAMQARLRGDLEGAFQPVGQRDFGDVWVTLLKARHTSRSSSTDSRE
jgi:mannosyltransferase